MKTGKLVRDKIIDKIINNNETPLYSILNEEDFLYALKTKLLEESNEFIESNDPEELADLLEVIYSIAYEIGTSPERIEEIRNSKAIKNGNFNKHIFLIK